MIFITMNCGFWSPQIASLLLIKELWHVWYLYLFRNNKIQMMSFFENEPNSFAPCGNILLYYQLITIIYHWFCSMWIKGLLRIHFFNRIKFAYVLRLIFSNVLGSIPTFRAFYNYEVWLLYPMEGIEYPPF